MRLFLAAIAVFTLSVLPASEARSQDISEAHVCEDTRELHQRMQSTLPLAMDGHVTFQEIVERIDGRLHSACLCTQGRWDRESSEYQRQLDSVRPPLATPFFLLRHPERPVCEPVDRVWPEPEPTREQLRQVKVPPSPPSG